VDRSYSAYVARRHAPVPESHQRSWWIIHILPTAGSPRSARSNPTNEVGGSFILSLHRAELSKDPIVLYPRLVHLEPLKEISWAYQLHYHICFRTHRRKPVFDDQFRVAFLGQSLSDLCEINGLHLLEKDCQPRHVQLVLSLRPNQAISVALQRLKSRSSAEVCRQFDLVPPLWARGYLARSTGRVSVEAVKRYLAIQAEHHGYNKRPYPPVFRFKAAEPKVLTTAHASFDLTHHLVLATRYRRGVFGAQTGEALVSYWMKVADLRGFAVERATILPDHVHLLVRITPKISVEQAALSLMNNAQHYMARQFPLALVEARIDQLWQPSAYVGTCGELTTALLKAFLRVGVG
jgi:putative transposase